MAVRVEQFRNATVFLGDCLELVERLPAFDLLLTDMPYSSGGMVRSDRVAKPLAKYGTKERRMVLPDFSGDNRDQRSFTYWATLVCGRLLAQARPGAFAALFTDWRQLPSMSDALQAGGWVWRGIVPWDKVNSRPMPNRFRSQCEYVLWGSSGALAYELEGARYHPGLLREPAPGADRVHMTQKPVGILQQLCKIVSPGATVVDPFMGSGSTGLAALREGQRFVGIEKDEAMFEAACRRLEAATAVLSNTAVL